MRIAFNFSINLFKSNKTLSEKVLQYRVNKILSGDSLLVVRAYFEIVK